MTVHGRNITKADIKEIEKYMDSEIKEMIISELGDCEPEEFLKRYLEEDIDLLETLREEFDFVGSEKVYYKVYSNAVRVPKHIIPLTEEEVKEIIVDEPFDNDDYEVNVEWNWIHEDPDDEDSSITQECMDAFYSHVSDRLGELLEEMKYIDCGDYQIVVSDEYGEPNIPNVCGSSMAMWI